MISTFRTSDFQISGSAISSHKNIQKIWHTSKRYKKKMGIVRDMGDLQREIDKFLKLAYNILIKTASKGSQGSPSWQICLAKI